MQSSLMLTITYLSMNSIKIETTGKILEGEHKNWFIFVENDYKNTGGYLILLFNNRDRLKSSQGYDYWAEDKCALAEMFKEAKWNIQWLNDIS
jgi:hypothetical protein